MATDELTLAFQQELKRTREATSQAAEALWRNLGSYNEIDVKRFVKQVEPIVRAGQQRAISLTDAYLSSKVGTAPVGISLENILPNVRNGVPLMAELKRSFQSVWNDLGNDIPWADAVERGARRVASSVGMDVLMAYTNANVAFANASSEKIYGWTRVAGAGCCSYCADISGEGNRMYRSDLMPLHTHCNCTVYPVTSKFGSGDRLRMNERVGSSIVREHGELGPIVTDVDDKFTQMHIGPGGTPMWRDVKSTRSRPAKRAVTEFTPQDRADVLRDGFENATDPAVKASWAQSYNDYVQSSAYTNAVSTPAKLLAA